jgi:hypothetical protein
MVEQGAAVLGLVRFFGPNRTKMFGDVALDGPINL